MGDLRPAIVEMVPPIVLLAILERVIDPNDILAIDPLPPPLNASLDRYGLCQKEIEGQDDRIIREG
jgi:hypothetical protein